MLSQPDLDCCGVVAYRPRMWAGFSGDGDEAAVAAAAAELVASGYVVVDDSTDELWIRTFMRHDGVIKTPTVFKAAVRAYDAIHSNTIREAILEHLPPQVREGFPHRFLPLSPKEIAPILKGAATPPDTLWDTPTDTLSDGVSDTPARATATSHQLLSSASPQQNPEGPNEDPHSAAEAAVDEQDIRATANLVGKALAAIRPGVIDPAGYAAATTKQILTDPLGTDKQRIITELGKGRRPEQIAAAWQDTSPPQTASTGVTTEIDVSAFYAARNEATAAQFAEQRKDPPEVTAQARLAARAALGRTGGVKP